MQANILHLVMPCTAEGTVQERKDRPLNAFFLCPLYFLLNVRICEYTIGMAGSLEMESHSAAQLVKRAGLVLAGTMTKACIIDG